MQKTNRGEANGRAKIRISATKKIREQLAKADPIMGAVIEKYGVIDYELHSNYLNALILNIVGQQLSGRVADVIWGRVLTLFEGEITATKVLKTDDEKLRSVGLSKNKAAYIKNIAQAATAGSLPLDDFNKMDDKAIVMQLTAIKGIGEWTAEMFLIFSLGRLDVFSKGDGGLPRAIDNLYNCGEPLVKAERLAITEKWKPYRSIASLYLWRSLNNR